MEETLAMTQDSGVQTGLKGSSVTATSVASSGGFCNFTKASHGLSVGDIVEVSGATASSLNTVHNITAVTTNTFKTDVTYTASATAGVYKQLTGTKNVLADYIVPTVTNALAGSSNTVLQTSGGYGPVSDGIPRSITERRYDVTSWDYVTGAVTKGANAGDAWTFDTASGSGNVDDESLGIGSAVIYDGSKVPSGVQYS